MENKSWHKQTALKQTSVEFKSTWNYETMYQTYMEKINVRFLMFIYKIYMLIAFLMFIDFI